MRKKLILSALIAAGAVAPGVHAQSIWTGGSGNWSSTTAPGWTTGGVPNAIGATGTIIALNANTVITQDVGAGVTIGTLSFAPTLASNFSMNVTPTSSLIFNQDGAGAGFATLSNSNASTGTTNALILDTGTITLNDDLLISNTGGSTNTTGAIQIVGTLGGSGNLTLANSSTALTQTGSIRFQTGVNTFTGTVLVQKGTTTFNLTSSFGAVAGNTITLGQSGQGSAALLSTTAVGTVLNNLIVASGSGGTLTLGSTSTAASGGTTYSGTVLLNGELSLTSANASGGSTTLSGVVSGGGALTKVGTGFASLTGAGANTFSGLTTVSAGNLHLGKSGGVNAIGGNLSIAGGSVTFNAGSSQNQIPNAASVTVSSGTLNGTATNVTTAAITETIGSLAITGGTFNGGSGSAWTIAGAAGFTGGGTGTIFVGNNGVSVSSNSLSLTGMTATAGATVTTSNSFTLYGTNSTTASTWTVGSGGLSLNGSVLNLRRGGTAGQQGSRLVLLGDVTTAGTTASSIIEDTNGGTVGIRDVQLSNVAGAFTRTFTTASGGANLTVSVPITNGTGTAGIIKAGLGSLTLSGTNAYTGATTINAGTLALSGTGAINSSSAITVNGSTAKFVQGSSVASTPGITVTQGTLTGSGTVGVVNVGAGTGAIVSNNDGVAGASLTTGSLTFNGAAIVNTFSNGIAAPLIVGALSTNVAGTVTINPTAPSWTNGSTYNLISYTGGSIGGAGFGQFALGTVTGLTSRQSASALGNTGTAITLAIAGDNPFWTGAANGNWNTTATNWQLLAGGTPTQFIAADEVLFNDSGANTTIDINAANVAPTLVTFNNTTAVAYTIGSTGGFGIASGSVTKTNTGTVTLSTVNTYSGATTIGGGILNANSTSALGNGSATNTLIFTGGTFQAGGTITSPATRTVTLTSTGVVDTNGNAVSIAGIVSGPGGLTKTGAGTLTLSSNNTYSGNTTISAGTLEMASNLIPNSPTISIGNNATLLSSAGLSLSPNQNITGTGATGFVTTSVVGLTVTGGSVISSSGTLTLIRFNVLGTGNQITGGDIQSGGAGTNQRGLGIGNGGSGTLTITGGTLTSNGGGAGNNQDFIGNTNGAGSPNATLIINGGSYVNTASTGTLQLGLSGSLAGNGTLTITAGSATIHTLNYILGSFAGNTGTVNLDGGTLTLSRILSTSGTNRIFNFNGGQLIAGASLPAFSGLTLNVKNGGAKIDTNGNSFTISDPLVKFSGATTDSLTKTGTGTLTLTGTSTYTGPTTITSGSLIVGVAGTGSLANTALTVGDGVNPNTGTLGGSGSIGNTGGKLVTIEKGGTVAPGNSVGTLTTGDQAWKTGGTYAWELADATGTAGSGWDNLVVGGNIDLTGTTSFTIKMNTLAGGSPGAASNFNAASAYTWPIATATNVINFDASVFLLDDSGFTNFHDGLFSVSSSGGVISVNYAPVPEPGSLGLLMGAATMGLLARRRGRRVAGAC